MRAVDREEIHGNCVCVASRWHQPDLGAHSFNNSARFLLTNYAKGADDVNLAEEFAFNDCEFCEGDQGVAN